jgi:hypothetical protein
MTQYKHHKVHVLSSDHMRVEVHTEHIRRLPLTALAGECDTPMDGAPIDAAEIVVGGVWSYCENIRVRAISVVIDGQMIDIPAGYEIVQRTISGQYKQYALVRTTIHEDDIIHTTKRTPPPDTTTT